jgi:hypothetical protein
MKLLALLKGKILLTVIASIVLVGGATAAFATTPAGQQVVQSITQARPTVTATATHGAKHPGQNGTPMDQGACPGLPEAQNLAAKYHLSTASQGDAVKAICALHQGTFKDATTGGATVTASRVYGYGEIDQLLTYAQYLAAHNSANPGGKLDDTNVSSYLATALHTCGSSPLETCLQTSIPNYQPGSGNGNKPAATPTPKGNKPTVTPTPHH